MVFSPRRHTARLEDARWLSATVRSLALRSIGTPTFQWEAGQFVRVAAPTSEPVEQPFSIASAMDPEAPGRFEIAVGLGIDARASRALQQMPVGAVVGIDGPFGAFTRGGRADLPAVFVGAGTGLSPLRAMIQSELREEHGPEALLVFGARSVEDLLWRDEFEALACRTPRFRFEPTLSRPNPSWTGRSGYAQDHLKELVSPLGGARAYVCGLADMVEACVRTLVDDVGVDPDLVFTEKY